MDGETVGEATVSDDVRLVNLTPHPVVVRWDSGEVSLPSEGLVRVEEESENAGEVAGVPVSFVRPGRLVGLPEPTPNTYYVVSRIVAQAAVERDDLLFPFGEIRDANGRIVAVAGLGRF